MSMLRKTVLTTAIIGAGLASTTGAAFASDCHSDGGHHKSSHERTKNVTNNNSCSNTFGGSVENGGSKQLGLVNGSQGALQGNLCNVLNGNKILSDNNVSILGGDALGGLPV